MANIIKQQLWLKLALGIVLVLSTMAIAQPSSLLNYRFDSAAQQQQFQQLTEQLRCLVCQNESLWDSNASLAKDLRTDVYIQVKKGQTNEEIKRYLVARYGEFILFKPTFHASTYLLWIIPFLLLAAAFLVVVYIVKSSGKPENNQKE